MPVPPLLLLELEFAEDCWSREAKGETPGDRLLPLISSVSINLRALLGDRNCFAGCWTAYVRILHCFHQQGSVLEMS